MRRLLLRVVLVAEDVIQQFVDLLCEAFLFTARLRGRHRANRRFGRHHRQRCGRHPSVHAQQWSLSRFLQVAGARYT